MYSVNVKLKHQLNVPNELLTPLGVVESSNTDAKVQGDPAALGLVGWDVVSHIGSMEPSLGSRNKPKHGKLK